MPNARAAAPSTPLDVRAPNGMSIAQLVAGASDVGLHVVYTRSFGTWDQQPARRSGDRGDGSGKRPLLMMDSSPDPGFIIGRFCGHAMPTGRAC